MRTADELGTFVFVPRDQIIQLTLPPLDLDHVRTVAPLIHQLPHLVEAHPPLPDAAFQLLELPVHIRSLCLRAGPLHSHPKVPIWKLSPVVRITRRGRWNAGCPE